MPQLSPGPVLTVAASGSLVVRQLRTSCPVGARSYRTLNAVPVPGVYVCVRHELQIVASQQELSAEAEATARGSNRREERQTLISERFPRHQQSNFG